MTLPPGTRLGRYEILSPLGAGGMGEVYRARDTRLDRDVAVKVLAQHLGSQPDVRARFEREARTISALDHPHLCTLFDVGNEGDTDFLVMELLEGESLATRLARGPLPYGEVLRLGAQIADALSCAHRSGVVHRDLKPGNVMLTRSGAKLLDFGLARTNAASSSSGTPPSPSALSNTPTVEHPLTAAGVLVGTFPYMAPEQLEGKDADARSDIWALGCVLYEMATGKRAFDAPSRAALIAAILEREPAPMAGVAASSSPALDRLVQACIAKQPDDRVQTAHDVKLQLEWLRAEGSSTSAPAAKHARAGFPMRTVLGYAALAALIVTGFVVGRGAAPGKGTALPIDIQRRTFRSQSIFAARFVRDSHTLVMSAALSGNHPRLWVLRENAPEPQPIGPENVHLLSVSSRGELAVLDHARFTGHHRLFEGTLSRMPLEGAAPRALMDDVREADWAPDGEEMAVIHQVGGSDRLEYPVGKVLHTSTGYLSDVRVSPNGDAVAFMEHPQRWDDRGSVMVVGRDGNGRARVLATGFASMEGLAWSPRGDVIHFSATENGSEYLVYEVSRDGGARTPARSLGFVTLHDIAPDGTWAATHDEIPTQLRYRRAGSAAETDVSWLDSANQPTLSADGRTLALSDQSVIAGGNYSAVVRPAAGGPIVRLGEGIPEEFSPDGRSLVAVVPSSPPHIFSYPLGTGAAKRLDPGGFENILCVRWLPDGRRLLVCGNMPKQDSRTFVLEPGTGHSQAVGPEGLWECYPAPDGAHFAARSAKGWVICATTGDTAARVIPGMRNEDEVIRWSRAGDALYCFGRGDVPAKVDLVKIATGERRTVTVLGDHDAAGLIGVLNVSMTEDLGHIVYCGATYQSTMYTVSHAR